MFTVAHMTAVTDNLTNDAFDTQAEAMAFADSIRETHAYVAVVTDGTIGKRLVARFIQGKEF